ncbi:MAG TPA: EamA family transporter [Bryobacteraceae bacterium]|nr:EamA family transporter [Bryobacteraceae bacterium]
MALFAVYFFWGTTYLGIRMALEAVPPVLLIGTRFVLSGGILLIAAKLYGATIPRGRELWLTALFGLVALGGGNSALVFAEQWIPSGIAALFVTTSPFWMVGIDAMRGQGDKLSKWTIVGIAVGFLGIVVLVGPAALGVGLGPVLIQAFLVLQVGCFCWCLGSVLQKSLPTDAHPVVSGAIQQLATGLFVLPMSLFTDEHPVNWNSRGIWAAAYLVVFGSIVGYSAFIYAMEHLPVAVVSTYAYVNPIVAVALGWLFYREPFGLRELFAMALVIVGVFIVKYYGHATPKAREASV